MTADPIRNSDIEKIAEKVAEQVTHRIFMILGTDITDNDDLHALQRDFAHVRAWRENMDTVKKKSLATAVAFIVTGVLGYLMIFFSSK